MSNMAKQLRKDRIKQVRAEARKAFRDSQSRGTCPYRSHNADCFQWLQGFDDEEQVAWEETQERDSEF